MYSSNLVVFLAVDLDDLLTAGGVTNVAGSVCQTSSCDGSAVVNQDPGYPGWLAQVPSVADVSVMVLSSRVRKMVELLVGCSRQGRALSCPAACGQSSATPECIASGIVCSDMLGSRSLAPSHLNY